MWRKCWNFETTNIWTRTSTKNEKHSTRIIIEYLFCYLLMLFLFGFFIAIFKYKWTGKFCFPCLRYLYYYYCNLLEKMISNILVVLQEIYFKNHIYFNDFTKVKSQHSNILMFSRKMMHISKTNFLYDHHKTHVRILEG